ncbi:MAG: response regulator [Kovacikia sp.]
MTTRRILIIDDQEAIQAAVEFGLRLVAGWQVLTASSAAQGIQTALAEQPDAILLDLMMPDMDGIAALRELQAHSATAPIPVILLTAKAQLAEEQQFNHLGVSGVIAKPFNALNLPNQIARILHWQSQSS